MRLLHYSFVRFVSISAVLGIFTILATPRQAITNAISTQISASPTVIVATPAVTATETLSSVSTATAIVTKLEDTDDGKCDPDDCSLREAVSSLTSGGAITFADDVEGVIDLYDTIHITNVIEIRGKPPKSDVVILRAKNSHLLFKVEPEASLTLKLLTLAGNPEVHVSGGIFVVDAHLEVINSTIRDNSVSAIYNLRSTTKVSGSTFYRNSGAEGGAISNDFGTVSVKNSTFIENRATIGGAIVNIGIFNVEYSTFANNSASTADIIDARRQLAISNSILLGNAKSKAFSNCRNRPLTDNGHNIQFPYNDCSNTIPVVDPLLSLTLADNGGPTQTLALLNDSPAIDSGDSQACAIIEFRDQRGFPRSSDKCDIGAYEQQ